MEINFGFEVTSIAGQEVSKPEEDKKDNVEMATTDGNKEEEQPAEQPTTKKNESEFSAM